MRLVPIAGSLAITTVLTGCAGGELAAPVAAPISAPNLGMTGRWMLSAPNAPACGMSFEGAPQEKQGVIEPEGGCPGTFYKSRRWQFAQDQLTIFDHENKPLGQLKSVGGYFQGESNAGIPVTLKR
jgi:Protease inhibitor Inh